MHILLITWNYPPKVGGMENMLSQLVEQWNATERVDVLGPAANDSASDISNSVFRPKKDGLLYFFLTAFYNGVRLLRKKDIDIIVAGSALVSPLAVVLGFLFRLPVVTQTHGLDIIYKNPVYQKLIRFFLPKCKLIICNSRNTKELAIKSGISHELLEVINPGIMYSEFQTEDHSSAKLSRNFKLENRKILLSAGRLAKRKGIPEFIENALPQIIEKHPEVLFVVAGENPTQSLTHKEDIKSQIEAAAMKKTLTDNVRVLGQVPRQQLLALYRSADVFVLPAINVPLDVEGFGIVLIEAGAAGCPVVATDLGGIPDAVENKKSGLLTEEGDWQGMIDAIDHLLTDQHLASSMADFGQKRVRDNYDWSIVGKRYLSQFSSLLEDTDPDEISP